MTWQIDLTQGRDRMLADHLTQQIEHWRDELEDMLATPEQSIALRARIALARELIAPPREYHAGTQYA